MDYANALLQTADWSKEFRQMGAISNIATSSCFLPDSCEMLCSSFQQNLVHMQSCSFLFGSLYLQTRALEVLYFYFLTGKRNTKQQLALEKVWSVVRIVFADNFCAAC